MLILWLSVSTVFMARSLQILDDPTIICKQHSASSVMSCPVGLPQHVHVYLPCLLLLLDTSMDVLSAYTYPHCQAFIKSRFRQYCQPIIVPRSEHSQVEIVHLDQSLSCFRVVIGYGCRATLMWPLYHRSYFLRHVLAAIEQSTCSLDPTAVCVLVPKSLRGQAVKDIFSQ